MICLDPTEMVWTLRPSVKHHNSESITPTSNLWAVGLLRVCLGPEQPIGSQKEALPPCHWSRAAWSVSGFIFPSKELEEVCSAMNVGVLWRQGYFIVTVHTIPCPFLALCVNVDVLVSLYCNSINCSIIRIFQSLTFVVILTLYQMVHN